MKTFILFLGIFLLSTTATLVHGAFQELYFTQKLMPIDQFDTRTWENRYYLDDANYTPGGPVFVSTSASVTFATDMWLDFSYFFDMGRDMSALLVHTQHRFYLDNRPTE